MALSVAHKQQLDTGIRGAFQHALEKYAMPNLMDMPQFQNFAREVANELYDSLDDISLPETIDAFKRGNKNKQDSRSLGNKPHAVGQTDTLQEGLDNVPQESTVSPEELSPRQTSTPPASGQPTEQATPEAMDARSPSHNIPLAPTPNVGAQATGEGASSQIPQGSPSNLVSRLAQPALNSGGVDQQIAQHGKQRGAATRGVNALRHRRPLKKIERTRKVVTRKRKKLNKHLKKLERMATPLRALSFTLKRTLNLILIIMIFLYTIGVLLCLTIIGIKLGIPLISATAGYGSRIRAPIKQYLKRVEHKLSALKKKIKATKKGLGVLQKKLQKLAQQERKLRNQSLLSFGGREARASKAPTQSAGA